MSIIYSITTNIFIPGTFILGIGCHLPLNLYTIAAHHGHFEIVKWLHDHENGCFRTKTAYSMAIDNDHHEIAKWIRENNDHSEIIKSVLGVTL